VTYGEKENSCINFVEEDPLVRPGLRWHDTTKRVLNKWVVNWFQLGKNNIQSRAFVNRLIIPLSSTEPGNFQLNPTSKLGLCPVEFIIL
jgi:hypothetical protein